MNFKKLSRIVNNPRHIEGIHNYCDRWCERCPFTLRCSNFAVGEAEGENREHTRKLEGLWPRLEALTPVAVALIATHADHPGVGLAKEPRFKKVRPEDERHRVVAAAKRYMEFAHQFVGQRQGEFARMPLPEGGEGVSLAEAFDVISWHQHLITVKLSRAMHRNELDEEMENDPEFAGMPRDQDGSGKIALISMDRSILAWTVFHEREPATAATSRLRTAAEKELPKARLFVRPGFDTVRFGK